LHKSKQVQQVCEELARTVGAAKDVCILAWDSSPQPLILFATAATESVFRQQVGALVGQPVGSLFAGGERAAKDLAALC